MNLESWTNQSVAVCFDRIAADSPEQPAVVSGETRTSRGALATAAKKIAQALMRSGVSPGMRVALLLPDDIPMIIGWLGVLKAGAVCVPLSCYQPEERLRAIMADADPVVLITNSSLLDSATNIAVHCPRISVLNLGGLDEMTDDEEWRPAITPESHAYIVYTSGTTGKPKGVIQTHRNLLKNVHVLSELMRIRADDRLAGLTAFSMGQGIATMFVALLNGAVLYPYPMRQAGVASLAHWLGEHKISVYTSSVSVFREFAASLRNDVSLPHLRIIRLGAEKLHAVDVALFQQRFPRGCILFNCLGTTETMNYARYVIDHDTVITGDTVPVGAPPEGTTLSLIRPDGGECSDGKAGEIIVHSRYLSPGYWRDPELTARRFQGTGVDRCYHTGDLALRLPDGSFAFLGRVDNQVKIRGNRVEPGGIESMLLSHPDVRQAAVVIRQNPEAELVAHVAGSLSEDVIRVFLKEKLPGFMVPSRIVCSEALPLTVSGKVDRHALQQMQPAEGHRVVRGEYKMPRNEWERSMAECWSRVLGIDSIGIDDDFFSLGGDSLKALRLFAEIKSTLNISIDVSDVIPHFTVASMGAIAEARNTQLTGDPVAAAHANPAWSFLVPIRRGVCGEPLIIFPGGWGGDNEIMLFAGIAGALKTDRSIYAVRSRAMDDSWAGAHTLGEHAAAVLEEIRQVAPSKGWLLIGECVASALAMEVASRAEACRHAPKMVLLLDPYTPPQKPLLSRLLGWWKAPQPVVSGSHLPEQIRIYYHRMKNSRPAAIHRDLHVVVAMGWRDPRHAWRYWKKLTRVRPHLHTVRGTHDTYLREGSVETVTLINDVLSDTRAEIPRT